MVLTSSSTSFSTSWPLQYPLDKEQFDSFWLGWRFARLAGPLAALSCFLTFIWVSLAIAHTVQPSCLTTNPKPFALSGLKPGSPSWDLAFRECLWPLLIQSSLPPDYPRTIKSEWTRFWWPPWFFLRPLLTRSSLPAWLSQELSDISRLDPDSPPWPLYSCPLEFPLRFIFRAVSASVLLSINCIFCTIV